MWIFRRNGRGKEIEASKEKISPHSCLTSCSVVSFRLPNGARREAYLYIHLSQSFALSPSFSYSLSLSLSLSLSFLHTQAHTSSLLSPVHTLAGALLTLTRVYPCKTKHPFISLLLLHHQMLDVCVHLLLGFSSCLLDFWSACHFSFLPFITLAAGLWCVSV